MWPDPLESLPIQATSGKIDRSELPPPPPRPASSTREETASFARLPEAAPVLDAVGMSEINKIFAGLDALGVHREHVVIPLGTGKGRVRRMPSGKLEIMERVDGARAARRLME